MKIGIISSAYFDVYGDREGAKRLIKHGYSCIDYQNLANTETDFFKLPEREFEAVLGDQKRMFADLGVTVNQAHGPWRWPIRDYSEEDRRERLESMQKALRGAAYLGAENLVIHPIMPFGVYGVEGKPVERAEETVEMNREFYSSLLETAKEYGVTVCLENTPFPDFILGDTKQVTDFVRSMNDERFKVCFDTGHALIYGEDLGDSVRYIGGDLLRTLHVHDNDGIYDRHWHIGDGVGDFTSLVQGLRDIGFDRVFSLETHCVSAETPEERERKEIEIISKVKELLG